MKIKITVEVDESSDLKTWKHAKTVDLAVPVKGEKGYYILNPK